MKRFLFFSLLIFTSQTYGYHSIGDGSNVFFAEALLWKLGEGSAENWGQKISPTGSHQTAKLLGIPFKWNPGARLGFGHQFSESNWDTVFSYTWFRTNGKKQANLTSGNIDSAFLGNFFVNNLDGRNFGPSYRHANMRWKVSFNVIDVELGHACQIDPYFQLRPFIGLKSGFIHHNIHSHWQNPTNANNFTQATEIVKNNFAGVGPSIGLNSKWSIYETTQSSIHLFGHFSGSLLAGRWHFKDQYRNNAPTSVSVRLSSIRGAATMARGLLGIEWSSCVLGGNIAIRLGYEAQVWFDQMQYYSLNMGRVNSLMSLQGGVLGFAFYF